MNFKSTAALFGLLLGMLWLFGLMLAYKKTATDESFILPNLQASADYEIDSVTIHRPGPDKQPEEFQFTLKDDIWSLRQPKVKQVLRVESFRISSIVTEIKSARKSDEVTVAQRPAEFGLDPPLTTVILHGKHPKSPEKTWKLFLGKDSADNLFVYANSSDRPGKVFAVSKNSIDSLLFKDPNSLRSRRIFESQETTVQTIALKQGKDEVVLKRDDSGNWRFEKPPLGFADYEGQPASAKKEALPEKQAEGGVKNLLTAILSMRVDSEEDFVAAKDINPANFGLEEGKEQGRIELTRAPDKDRKEPGKETLLLGRAVEGKKQVFARLAGDEGIFKLNAKLLDPMEKALANPGKLRSTDVAFFDIKKVDALVLKYGKDETKIWSGADGKSLQMQTGSEKPVKASDKAVQALLETLQGKREIQKFFDDPDGKKLDAELGFDAPAAQVTVYVDGLDKDAMAKEPKEKESKDKKDDKKETKKDDGPIFKKEVKPAVVLFFGKTDKDLVHVKREFADAVSRFAIPKSILDKVAPVEGALAFLDTALPNYQGEEIIALKLQRGSEKLEIVKGQGDQANRWFFKEAVPSSAQSQADLQNTNKIVNALATVQVKKWLRKIAAGEDLDKYGLKSPPLVATLQIKKDRLQPAAAASASVLLGGPAPWTSLLASSAIIAHRELDPGASIDLKIGKETDQDKDKPGYFAQHSGSDLLFLAAPDLVRSLREIDLRDRTGILQAEAYLAMGLWGLGAAEPQTGWLFVSPLASGHIQAFDAAKVKEVKFAVRTPQELRAFAFERSAKEKTWQDKTGLQEFNLDADKLNNLLKDLGDLKTERFVSLAGPKPEHKLGPKDYQLKIDLIFEDGKTVTITVGTTFERLGYFAQSTAWPEAVFLLPTAKVGPLLSGIGYFAKERLAGGS